MEYTFQGEDSGNQFWFQDEAAYERALAWYSKTSKQDIIDFCRGRGIDITDDNGRLVEDWAYIAMELYAK